ncbi:MAG: hypothetical protein JSR13_06065 [Proteobacteria bacterium]|nr:hypothetical protein [Pseudomonadota bacterium]
MAKNSILDYDTTPDNNTDMGGIPIQGTSPVFNFDNAFRTLMSQVAEWTGASSIASGTTTDLSTVKGTYVSVSGASTITSLGTAKAGWIKHVRFTGTPTLTHNATSLILPGGSNISVSAGDTAIFVSEGSGNWRCAEYYSSFAKTFMDDSNGASAFNTLGATNSFATFGYQKLPSGLIIQWGSLGLGPVGAFNGQSINGWTWYTTFYQINLPIAFPTAGYAVSIANSGYIFSSQGSMAGVTCNARLSSLSQIEVSVGAPQTGNFPAISFIAVGI